jgi:hypothetical protein
MSHQQRNGQGRTTATSMRSGSGLYATGAAPTSITSFLRVYRGGCSAIVLRPRLCRLLDRRYAKASRFTQATDQNAVFLCGWLKKRLGSDAVLNVTIEKTKNRTDSEARLAALVAPAQKAGYSPIAHKQPVAGYHRPGRSMSKGQQYAKRAQGHNGALQNE